MSVPPDQMTAQQLDSPLANSGDVDPRVALERQITAQQGRTGAIEQALAARYDEAAQGYSAYKDLLNRTAEGLRNTNFAPSPAEISGRLAAGFAAPTRTGSLGERFGNLGAASAQSLADRRQADIAKQELLAKYGAEAAQAGISASQMGLQGLVSQENNAQNRIGSALGQLGNYDMRDAMLKSRNANQPITIVNGQPQVNKAYMDAQRQKAIAEGKFMQLDDQTKELAYQNYITTGNPGVSIRNGSSQRDLWDYIANRAHQDGNDSAAIAANGAMYKASQGVLKDFTSGKTSQEIKGLNTSIQHVGVLNGTIDALHNNQVVWSNQLKNAFQTYFTGNPAPTDFNTVRDFVAGEIAKAALPGGGGEAERQEIAKAAKAASDPGVLKSVVGKWEELLAGKTEAQRREWEVGTGGRYGTFDKFLMPDTKKALGIPLAPGEQPAQATPTDQDIAYLKAHPETAPKFKAHFGALPEGFNGG